MKEGKDFEVISQKMTQIMVNATVHFQKSREGETKCVCCEGGRHIYRRYITFDGYIQNKRVVGEPFATDIQELLDVMLMSSDDLDGKGIKITIERLSE